VQSQYSTRPHGVRQSRSLNGANRRLNGLILHQAAN
jgi:hypothetical protein